MFPDKREMSGTGQTSAGVPGPDEASEGDLRPRIEAMKAFLARRNQRDEAEESESPLRVADPPADPTSHFAAEAPAAAPLVAAATPPAADAAPELTPGASDTRPPSRAQRMPRLGRMASPLPADWTRHLWIAAATIAAVGLALMLTIAGIPRSIRGAATGTLSVETRPAGVAIAIDGVQKGVTPIQMELAPGDHIVELTAGAEHRRVPVTIRAGSQSSQFLEMAAAMAPPTGGTELRVRTEPLGASVMVDSRYVGRSPVSVPDLAPGTHTVLMQHEGNTVTEQVLIEPGKTASLFVPLAAKPPAAAAGWISVSAPVDVQLFENGRLLGSSTIERIMVPVGRHDLDIVNEPLGYQERRTVRVNAGEVAPVTLTWPKGSLSINAVPWAEVFVDGTSAGETPIGNIQVPIGPHEIIFRNPKLGERRETVVVTTRAPAKVGIDLRAK